MPSHLDSNTTTDIKPEMLSGDHTGNKIPHGYDICGIAHAQAYRKDELGKVPKIQRFVQKVQQFTIYQREY